MPKYEVTLIWSQTATAIVEADNVEEAEEKGYDKVMRGDADFDTEISDEPDIEVEEL